MALADAASTRRYAASASKRERKGLKAFHSQLLSSAADARRTADRTGLRPNPGGATGKAQKYLLAAVAGLRAGQRLDLSEIPYRDLPVHFAQLQKSAEALARKGLIGYDTQSVYPVKFSGFPAKEWRTTPRGARNPGRTAHQIGEYYVLSKGTLLDEAGPFQTLKQATRAAEKMVWFSREGHRVGIYKVTGFLGGYPTWKALKPAVL